MTHRRRVKRVVAILLLAVLCIGGAELVALRFAEPELYAQISNPVRRRLASLWDGLLSAGSYMVGTLQKNEAAPLEDQAAGEPATVSSIPTASTALTALEQREEGEVLTGGSREILYFNQADEAWSATAYGVDTLGKYGCGPTALAMAVTSLTDRNVDPADMARWSVDRGYWARHGGSYLSIVNGAAADYGLRVDSRPACTADQLLQELSSGKVAVALMTAGHFTKGGHFILLRGATLNGEVLVADPNSRERSLVPWDPQLILDELSPSRNNGAPLWFLSPAPEA